MKSKIPPRDQTCTVHCACGNTFTTRSTAAKITVDICSQCHPFFTGKQKLIDKAGRVDRFRRRYAKNQPAAEAAGKAEATETPANQ